MPFPPLPSGRRIGFWVADDDLYGAAPIFGNANNVVATPQQFFNSYFGTPPYPASLLWTGGLYSGASHGVPPAQEAQWLSQLLSICDGYPNIQVWSLLFINLSGNFIVGGHFNVSTGFSLARVGILTKFTIASTAGLNPNTTYNLQFLNFSKTTVLGTITSFTTDATGAWTGTYAIPSTWTPDWLTAQGYYIMVQGTTVQYGTGGTGDQTADFMNYMTTIKGHSSYLGGFFEPEYFGNSPAIQATFQSIVNGVNYYVLQGGTPNPSGGIIEMNFSAYPYLGGVLPTGTAVLGDMGYHIGFDSGPSAPDPVPIWTQATVLNIIHNGKVEPITILILREDVNNPATVPPAINTNGSDTYLYMSPIVRGWIANDSYYQTNYVKATAITAQPTTLKLSVKAT